MPRGSSSTPPTSATGTWRWRPRFVTRFTGSLGPGTPEVPAKRRSRAIKPEEPAAVPAQPVRARVPHRPGALGARRAGHDPGVVETCVQDPSAGAARAAEQAAAQGPRPGALGDRAVRRLGRRRQGRRHPAHRLGPRTAKLSGHPGRGAHRRGACPSLSVALLASPRPRRPRDDLRPQLVRPRPRRARREPRHAGRVEPRLCGDSGSSKRSSPSTGSCS